MEDWNDAKIAKLKYKGKKEFIEIGDGLFIFLASDGKSWIYKYIRGGVENSYRIGGFPFTNYIEAMEALKKAKTILKKDRILSNDYNEFGNKLSVGSHKELIQYKLKSIEIDYKKNPEFRKYQHYGILPVRDKSKGKNIKIYKYPNITNKEVIKNSEDSIIETHAPSLEALLFDACMGDKKSTYEIFDFYYSKKDTLNENIIKPIRDFIEHRVKLLTYLQIKESELFNPRAERGSTDYFSLHGKKMLVSATNDDKFWGNLSDKEALEITGDYYGKKVAQATLSEIREVIYQKKLHLIKVDFLLQKFYKDGCRIDFNKDKPDYSKIMRNRNTVLQSIETIYNSLMPRH